MTHQTKPNHEYTEAEVSKSFLYKLKAKWGLENFFQVVMVILVFAITGTTVVFLRKSLFEIIGFNEATSVWLKSFVYILFVFPAYQGLLLFYGSLFGQFHFFWNKEKKLFFLIKNSFKSKK
ncbi:MAG: hypothetical protein M3512_05045 [Bacteroidota bacterium]|nr:hypothetical protein [Bacteroidota bacterium]